MVNELTSVFEKHPGNTQLYFKLRDPKNDNLLLHSRGAGINLDRKLITELDSYDNIEYKVN